MAVTVLVIAHSLAKFSKFEQCYRQWLLGYNVTLIVECIVDSCASFRSLASPNSVFVFDQTGNVGVAGSLDARFRLRLGEAVSTDSRRIRVARLMVWDCGSAGIGICGGRSLCKSTVCEIRARQKRNN